MGDFKKLLAKVKNRPKNCRFRDICALAERVGFELRERQPGSHLIYKHPKINKIMNFQPDPKNKNMAKFYQVKQLLNFIEDYIPANKED